MLKKVMVLLFGAALVGSCTSRANVAGSSSPPTTPPPSTSTPPATSGYSPEIDPANFVAAIDNAYFPLPPGRTLVYEGVRDGKDQRDEFVVTHETKVIMGINCVVVRDTATRLGGTLIERTDDWFAQDKEGNVWYMGEDTKLFDAKGNVKSTEGSWEGGVDGAQPGIVMPAHPGAPSTYRQEFYRGHAQDMAWILDLAQSVTVPYGTFSGVLETLEWSPLEPDVIEKKYYVSGFGLVFSTSAAGEVENAQLVSVTAGP